MTKSFASSVFIDSSPEANWAILTDAPRWPKWNTTVDRVDGEFALGKKITVHAKISPGRAFPLTVRELDPGRRIVGSGGMPLGLFNGERVFTLSPQSDGSVEFTMREQFTGPLALLITTSIPDLQPSLDEAVAALKSRAEQAT
jgi:hypothetical protein